MPLLARLLLALALLSLPAAAQDTVSYYGVSHAGHQAHFDNLAPQGYRMISFTVAGDYNTARYSAVWRQVGGAPWVSAHGLTAEQYTSQANTWNGQGFRAQLVTASGTSPNVVFAAVWVLDGADVEHKQSTSLSSSVLDTQRLQGRRLTSFGTYTSGAGEVHIAVFEPNPQGFAWGVETYDDMTAFGHKFNELTLGHSRPLHFATSGNGRITHAWTDDRVGAWAAVAERNHFEFGADRTHYEGLGLTLTRIAARGTGAGARYAGIFQQRLVPDSRSFTRTGQAVPELAHFDTYVEDLMTTHRVRNASLAVTRYGRLVYARGYTHAEPGSFITQPTTPFRLGSISKPLTGTLIHDLISRGTGGFSFSTSMVNYLGITNYSPGGGSATIHRLLQHVSGMKNVLSEQEARDWWLNQTGLSFVPLPLDENIIVRNGCTLGFDSIDVYRYSNLGYTALGQVVEQATGQAYLTALRNRLFAPAGTTALYQQRPRPENHAPGEAPYFLPASTLEPTNLFSDYRLMANQYAREYWDSAGGTVSSAMVLARAVAGAFCIGDSSPTLLPTARASALLRRTFPRPNGSSKNVTDAGWNWSDLGNGRFLYTHDGAVDGFGARVVFTSDGLCIVLLTNMSSVTSSGSELVAEADLVQNWPSHDLFPNYGMPTFSNTIEIGTSYCSGDGNGTACPCGNTGNPGHGCANRVFSQGAELTATGQSPSISGASVQLRVSRTTPSQTGLFFQGTLAVNGGAGVAFGDGLRCAGGTVTRLQVRTASVLGIAATNIDVAAVGGVSAGQTRRYQWWYRDPGASPCATEFNTSNGLEITWQP